LEINNQRINVSNNAIPVHIPKEEIGTLSMAAKRSGDRERLIEPLIFVGQIFI
jgi:hypothetical protein